MKERKSGEHLMSMCKALGYIPSTTRMSRNRRKKRGKKEKMGGREGVRREGKQKKEKEK